MTTANPTAFQRLMRMSLISQIAIGLVLGVALALIAPGATKSVALLGDLFIAALKAVAPILVFVLVAAAIANHKPSPAHRINHPVPTSTSSPHLHIHSRIPDCRHPAFAKFRVTWSFSRR